MDIFRVFFAMFLMGFFAGSFIRLDEYLRDINKINSLYERCLDVYKKCLEGVI